MSIWKILNPLRPVSQATRDVAESSKRIASMLASVADTARAIGRKRELDDAQKIGVKIADGRERFEYYAQARGMTQSVIQARIAASRRVQCMHEVAAVAMFAVCAFFAANAASDFTQYVLVVLTGIAASFFACAAGEVACERTQLQERDLVSFVDWLSRRDALLHWVWPWL